MTDIFKKAEENHYAVGQFNVSNLETVKAVLNAARKLNSPVIIGTSEGEREFLGRREIVNLVETYQENLKIPIILNADHSKSFDEIKRVVAAGYGMVHFDGSELPLEKNIKLTRKVVEYVKKLKILVEGELGYLRGSSKIQEEVEIRLNDMTNPEEAAYFVKKTGIDSLAIAIGNVHGIVARGNPRLDLKRLLAIKKAVGNKAFLVLHGGSGITDKDIREAVKIGIVKININTELRVAYSSALRKTLAENPKETTPYKIFPKVIKAVEKVVGDKIKLFKSNNKLR